MKVLQVAYASSVSGGERVLLQVTAALLRAGHGVVAALPGPGPLEEALAALGVPVDHVRARATWDLPAARHLAARARERGVDLVHSHGMLVNVLCRLGLRGALPHVGTVHLTRDLVGPPRVGGWRTRWKNRLWYRPLDTLSARWSARTVAVSDAVREDLVRQGYPPDAVRVIRNAMDPAPFDAVPEEAAAALRASLGAEDAGAFLVAAVMRFSPQKDPETLLGALEAAAAREPALRALVAGEGPGLDAARARVEAAGLADRIHLLGRREDVPVLLRAADALLLTSRWEGLPLVVLEAMAARLPVVATAVPGTAEAVEEGVTGHLVPIGDPAAAGEALVRLAGDPARARRLGDAGRERLEGAFSLERLEREHLDLYREVLEGAGP